MGNALAPPSLAATQGMTTRSWRVDGVLLLVRHDTRRGTVELFVNGRLAHTRSGAGLDASCELLAFAAGPGPGGGGGGGGAAPGEWEVRLNTDSRPPTPVPGLGPAAQLWRLLIVDFPGLREFSLTINGRPAAEDGDVAARVEEQQRLRVQVLAGESSGGGGGGEQGARDERGDAHEGGSSGGQQQVRYHVKAVSSTGVGGTAERSFSEFDRLDLVVRSAFGARNAHLLSSMPRLPRKHLKVLVDRREPAFLERRREELDSYLRALVQLPRMGRSADVWVFLGLPGLPPTIT